MQEKDSILSKYVHEDWEFYIRVADQHKEINAALYNTDMYSILQCNKLEEE